MRSLEQLRAENDALKSKVGSGSGDASADSPQSSASASGAGAAVGPTPKPLVFEFPEARLPWPLPFLRVAPPGERPHREAYGHWLTLFRNAAPYIAAFRGGAVVIHVPSWMLDTQHKTKFKGLMEDVAFCSLLGLGCVVVASIEERLLMRLHQEGGYVDQVPSGGAGNRLRGLVLDSKALRIAMQEAGLARVEVESALSAGFEKRTIPATAEGGAARAAASSAGLFPVRGAVSVVSSTNFFTASPLGVRDGIDHGYAGLVRSVNSDVLERRLADGDVVCMTPVGASPSGEVFFVPSEELAATVARKLHAIKLVYVTRGQRLVDKRDGAVIAGMQLQDAQALLQHLEHDALTVCPEEVKSAVWFQEFLCHLRLLCSAVGNGVRRGHWVDPSPGALLQEFYTTDGSGTVVAQDHYQGLGRASVADAKAIGELLAADAGQRGLPLDRDAGIEAGCAAGELFVWKRDEVVLGCGRLTVIGGAGGGFAAELRCLAVELGQQDSYVRALLGYAERAAAAGGASLMVACTERFDAGRPGWLESHGFRSATPEEVQACLPPDRMGSLLVKPLDAHAIGDAEAAMQRFAEDQRRWGGLPH